MTENTENLILTILRDMRNADADMKRRMEEGFLQVNLRLNAIEQHMLANSAQANAYHERMTSIEQRIERLERRFELQG
jgi:hypothetical protein